MNSAAHGTRPIAPYKEGQVAYTWKGDTVYAVYLAGEGETAPPDDAGEVLAALPADADRAEATWAILEDWLARLWAAVPVYGCLLIGGKSRRMGTPKHLLEKGGRTWVERTAERLSGAAERVVIVGAGQLPASMAGATRLADVPDAEGPMSGLLAAMRWGGAASWLVAACDLPDLSEPAVEWLLSTRRPGVWATVPRLPGGEGLEPLLAHYDFRARALLEDLAAEGCMAPSRLAEHPKVITPEPPPDLEPAWRNVNTPADLSDTA